MTRGEIITRFREENPEATLNVVSHAVLQSWTEVGDLEICTRVRLVKTEEPFNSVIGVRSYNLATEITNFYDIDILPGGGVCYDGRALKVTTPAQLNADSPSWRTTSGTPTKYYRRGGFLYLNYLPTSVKEILVSAVVLPDPLNDDTKLPFNQLTHLKPFHYALVLYLKFRLFNGKIKKEGMAESSKAEYMDYINWMKQEIDRGIYSTIQLRPPVGLYGTGR